MYKMLEGQLEQGKELRERSELEAARAEPKVEIISRERFAAMVTAANKA